MAATKALTMSLKKTFDGYSLKLNYETSESVNTPERLTRNGSLAAFLDA